LGGKSRTSITLIIRRPAARPVTSPHLPPIVPLATSAGGLSMDPSSSSWLAAMPQETLAPEELTREVRVVPGANGASLGTVSVKADRASPRSGDDTGGSDCDLVTCDASLGMLGSAVPGDAIPATQFSSTAGPGVAGLPLLGSLIFLPPPIDWRQVEGDAEFPCS
jgi:hypothetical protein